MLEQARPLSEAELAAGLILLDPLLFRLYFFKDELTLEPSLEQKVMFCDQSDRVSLCTARKIAKTIHEEAMVFQAGITEGSKSEGVDEALMFTPSDNHISPVLDRIWSRFERTPLLHALIRTEKRGQAPILEFRSGLRWYFRIEGVSGTDTNMIGLRVKRILGDEMAFGNHVCHRSRLQTALPGCKWLYAGVPNGVRQSPFYEIDQTAVGKSWSRHKYPTFINPIYQTPHAKEQLIEDYGGEETQGYKNNVVGSWGEESISSFPPGSIAIDTARPYTAKEIIGTSDDELRAGLLKDHQIRQMVGIGTRRCKYFALGWDYGFSPDPAIVWGAYSDDGDSWYKHFCLTMRRVPQPHQIQIVGYLINVVFVGTFVGLACDQQGVIQTIQAGDPERAHLYMWGWPGGSTAMQIVERINDDGSQVMKVVNLKNKEMMTDFLKQWMINAAYGIEGRKLYQGNDGDYLNELVGTTERKTATGWTVYIGPPDPERRNAMLDHRTDGDRELCYAINNGMQLLDEDDDGEAADGGWIGGDDDAVAEWTPPWAS